MNAVLPKVAVSTLVSIAPDRITFTGEDVTRMLAAAGITVVSDQPWPAVIPVSLVARVIQPPPGFDEPPVMLADILKDTSSWFVNKTSTFI